MDFVCKLYGNTYAVHVMVALVGVATLNLALPPPPPLIDFFFHLFVAHLNSMGGWDAHPEDQNEEKMKKNLRKMRVNQETWGRSREMFLACPPGSERPARALALHQEAHFLKGIKQKSFQ